MRTDTHSPIQLSMKHANWMILHTHLHNLQNAQDNESNEHETHITRVNLSWLMRWTHIDSPFPIFIRYTLSYTFHSIPHVFQTVFYLFFLFVSFLFRHTENVECLHRNWSADFVHWNTTYFVVSITKINVAHWNAFSVFSSLQSMWTCLLKRMH